MKYPCSIDIINGAAVGRKQIMVIILLLWPILLSYILYPYTFGFGWNAGRGGFLIVAVIALFEISESRPVIKRHESWMLIVFASFISLYFIGLSLGASDVLSDIGRSAGALIDKSWISMWDYVILAIYFIVILMLIFGRKDWLRIGGAATLFLTGYAIILLLDSLFPYDSLGIFQFIVPAYMSFNAQIINSIIHILNIQTHFASQTLGNTLVIYGPDGPFVMKVYWPSAGIHSIIIFGLVMLAFFLKTVIPRKRAVIYLFFGILVTCIVNSMRITILSLYTVDPNLDLSSWEQLHSTIGEVLFIPWILLYAVFVIYLENQRFGAKRKTGFSIQ